MVESLDEKEKEKLRIEKLLGEISSQTSSTLVLSTVASSLSLTILTTLSNKLLDDRLIWAGLAVLFAFLGFLYREFTIHWSLIDEYRELNQKLSIDARKFLSSYRYVRMVTVRFFLLLPLAVFFLLVAPSYVIISGVGIFALSLTCSMCELLRTVDC